MNKKMQRGKQLLIDFLEKEGWNPDSRGNYLKEINVAGTPVLQRYHFNPKKVRKESKAPGFQRWVRLSSAFYSDISLDEAGRLQGFKR